MKRLITSIVLLLFAAALSPHFSHDVRAAGVPTHNPHFVTQTPTVTNTPTPTPTNTSSPTPTNTPTPTSHLSSTATPVATLTQTPVGTPVGVMPLCATHDINQYHALIKADGTCHYNHEHHANPNDAASVALFGQAGAWFGGTSISYPWETQNPVTGCFENDCKHNGYKWLVRHTGCVPSGTTGCFIDFREQVHFMATASDFVVPFHSDLFEGHACIAGRCGIIRTGGYQNYGCLYDGPAGKLIPIPLNPVGCSPIDDGGTPKREHTSLQDGFIPIGNPKDAVWYGSNAIVGIALFTSSEFGTVDLNAPTVQTFICPALDCGANGSNLEAHIVSMHIDSAVFAAYTVNGLVNFSGFTDVYGNVSSTCAAASLVCVPLVIVGLPVGDYGYRDDQNGFGADGYDTCLPLGQVCIEFPN